MRHSYQSSTGTRLADAVVIKVSRCDFMMTACYSSSTVTVEIHTKIWMISCSAVVNDKVFPVLFRKIPSNLVQRDKIVLHLVLSWKR